MKRLTKLMQAVFFLIVIGAILLFSDLSNRNRSKNTDNNNFRIALVNWIDTPAIEQIENGIFKGLTDHNIVYDENMTFDIFKASSDISMLNSIFNQIKTQQYDLIFVSCTPALQTAVNTIENIPVVFTAVADPILAGAGTDAFNHIQNITGSSVSSDFDLMCKIITENAPQIKILGSIYCPGEIISVKFREEFTQISKKFGLSVKFFPANNSSELPDAVLGMINSNIDAVCQLSDNLMAAGISTLIKGVVKARLPYFGFNKRPVNSSMESLVQMDVNYFQNGYDAACMAAQILLENISPGAIPFAPPSKTLLEINPLKAKTFGIEFNAETKQIADQIIETTE